MTHFFVQDDSGHWIQVESAHRKDWLEFCDIPENDERRWTLPSYAQWLGMHPRCYDVVVTVRPPKGAVLHPYHCFLCGSQLFEIGLGGLECPNCKTQFIPSEEDGHAKLTACNKPE